MIGNDIVFVHRQVIHLDNLLVSHLVNQVDSLRVTILGTHRTSQLNNPLVNLVDNPLVNLVDNLQVSLLDSHQVNLVVSHLGNLRLEENGKGAKATAPAANSKSLNWKSNGIELFISESITEAKELTEILQMLKGTMKRVEETVDIWSSQPIFDRAMKPV